MNVEIDNNITEEQIKKSNEEFAKVIAKNIDDYMIKEILDRLERIDHKEYSCAFEFADSSSFTETARCFRERKVLANYITNLQERIDKATNEIQYIIDYGFDYDGLNTVESLKGLIDMLVDYARKSKDILNGDNKDE